jgi:hypothetical protein
LEDFSSKEEKFEQWRYKKYAYIYYRRKIKKILK